MTSVNEDNARMQERAKIRVAVSDLMRGKKLSLDFKYRTEEAGEIEMTDEGVDVISIKGVKYIKAAKLLKHF